MKILKFYFLEGLLLMFNLGVSAQSKPDGSAPQFLFPEFTKSEVRMKNGKIQTAMINYNTVTERMVFRQGEKLFDMTETDRIDTVTIENRKFVPAGKVFHEVVLIDSITLFVQHKGDLEMPGKPAAYGGTSQTSSTTLISSMQFDSGYYNLKLPSDYNVRIEPVFWIRKNGVTSGFVTEKQFLKIFPDDGAELKKYIKTKKIKFDRIPDVQKLIMHCNEKGVK